MFDRILRKRIDEHWSDDKVIICIGPRQVGKSTLLNKICKDNGDYLFINGDDPEYQLLLTDVGEKRLLQIIGNHKVVFIDEAQRIKNIGLTSKIIFDRIKDVKLILCGSSALEMANQLNEPLTGRKWEYNLWPISWSELIGRYGYLEAVLQLETRLVYGMYPEVISKPNNEQDILKQLASSYLYKDILNLQNIRKPEVLQNLLHALALQVGSEVNYNELAQLIRLDRKTVEEYIGLLEKIFIIFRLPALSRNQRNEISNGRKIYFYDIGMRNAIIGDFRPLAVRQDIGALWENFIISELKKKNSYEHLMYREYFWRTYQQQEIDYILEKNGQFFAYEIKWNKTQKVKFPVTFTQAYQNVETHIINRDNFTEYL
jgi:predicted AAA+ superfamily ATPase